MSKVTLKVEIEEEAYKAFIEQEVISCGIGLLSETYHALKNATPLTECDDAVSRQYIESKVEELENICANAPEEVLDLLADIKNAPFVLPKREQGKWIGGICNKCHYDWSLVAPIASVPEHCPRCGAEMR